MDVRTLLITLVACNFLLGLFLYVFSRVQKPYPGFIDWMHGSLAMALGFASLAARDLVPLWLSVAGFNVFVPLACALRLTGLKKFFGRPPQYGVFWAVAAIPAVVLAALALGANDLERALLNMVYLDAFIFLTARELWLARDPVNSPLHLTMMGFYALSGVTITARSAAWLMHSGSASLLQGWFMNSPMFLVQIIVDIAWVTFFLAINVQRKNAEIRLANRELEEAARVKDRYLSVLGHDLRGPLGGLEAALETYIEERSSLPEAERLKLLRLFLERSRSINKQLEELLTWGRHQAGHERFAPGRQRLFDIAEKEALALPKEKSVVFVNDIDPDAEVYGDPAMLAGIMHQLLGNALKFTKPGGEVRLTLEPVKEGVLVSVADQGIGLPKEDLARIFVLGAVKARWGTEGEPGTGLGLPLCLQFVTRHGGKIWAENRPGGGAVFKFTLPAEQAAK